MARARHPGSGDPRSEGLQSRARPTRRRMERSLPRKDARDTAGGPERARVHFGQREETRSWCERNGPAIVGALVRGMAASSCRFGGAVTGCAGTDVARARWMATAWIDRRRGSAARGLVSGWTRDGFGVARAMDGDSAGGSLETHHDRFSHPATGGPTEKAPGRSRRSLSIDATLWDGQQGSRSRHGLHEPRRIVQRCSRRRGVADPHVDGESHHRQEDLAKGGLTIDGDASNARLATSGSRTSQPQHPPSQSCVRSTFPYDAPAA